MLTCHFQCLNVNLIDKKFDNLNVWLTELRFQA